MRATARTAGCYFYPRPPRGGRRCKFTYIFDAGRFLSTPSARRATHGRFQRRRDCIISIHALREEGDRGAALIGCARHLFLSTPSARRATTFPRAISPLESRFLSTPSARRATAVGSDIPAMNFYFYPRPPRGGRQLGSVFPNDFQQISIHALREEGDARTCPFRYTLLYFYPRPPRGGRRNGF